MITLTQAMINNNGIVIIIFRKTHNGNALYAEWVPIGRRPTLVLTPASIMENGGVSTVTATLSTAPTSAVTMTVSARAVSPAVAGDFTLSMNPVLTIAAGSTTSTGTVTVTAVNNAVVSPDKRVTVSGTAASSDGLALNPADATLTIINDDVPSARIYASSPSELHQRALNGSRIGVEVTNTNWVSSVQVSNMLAAGLTVHDFFALATSVPGLTLNEIVTVPSTSRAVLSLTYDGTDFNTPRAVTVTVKAAAHTGSGDLTTQRPVVPARDLDVSAATAGLDVAEEASGTYTVRLSSQPVGAVTVTVETPFNTDVTVAPMTLTYTGGASGTWNTAQTVTVRVADDADGADETATVAHTAAAGSQDPRWTFSPQSSESVTVRVTDNDPGVVVDPARLMLTEQDSGTYTVRLNALPGGTVTVSVASGDTSAVTVAPEELTFTTTTWNTAQPVTATASDDADNDHETVTVTHTLTGASEYAALAAEDVAGVTVAVTDDDAPRAEVTATTLTQAALNTAQVQVALTNAAWAAGVQVGAAVGSYFALGTSVPGLTLEAIASVPSTSTATLDLAYDGTAFDTARTLTVTVLAAAHMGSENLLTGAVPVTPTPGLTIVPTTGLRTTESGGTATFTVRLATAPTATVVLGLASSNTAEGTVAPTTLTFAAATWQTAQPVTLTGVDDATATPPNPPDGSQTYTITLTVDQTATADAIYDGMAAVPVMAVNQDNEYGLAVGTLTGQATEAGGTAAFTVALQTEPAAAVTVAVASQDPGEGLAAPGQLVYTTTTWETAQTVTVTGQNDNADDGTVTYTVQLDPASSDTNYNTLAAEDVTVTTTDDDGPPGVTLTLSATGLTESGAGSTATVTANLSHPSSDATTVTVTAGTAYTVGTDAVILIAAGETAASTDTATIIAVANTRDEPDRTDTVTADVGNARATADGTTMAVTGAALTVADDDLPPSVTLMLNPTSIDETGGLATVAAVLSHPSSAPSTVTVTAVAGAYTVGPDATIVIAEGDTANATDTATITGVDDTIHQGTASTHRTAMVTAMVTNLQGAGAVTGATLTLTDDETRPTVTLALTPASIAEAGGVATVTATLSGLSSQAVTLTVTATAVSPAVAGDFTLSGTGLTIAAGATTSTGAVTLTAADNENVTGSKQVTVAGTATGGHGVPAPTDATLTITDDDTPQPTLILTPASINENGGVATIMATLDRLSAAVVTVTVSATAGTGTVAGDFTLSPANTLTFAANTTTSTGAVTITAVNNAADAPAKEVTVSGSADDLAGSGRSNDPAAVTLTITDDDAAPNATLTLNPTAIAENGGLATVTATLDRPSSAPTTVTVPPVAGAYTVGAGAAATIVLAAGTTANATDSATITGVDDAIHQGTAHRTAMVTATLTNTQSAGAGTVTGATLTLTDDETLPTVTLAVTPTAITEAAQTAQVTATLSGLSSEAVTLTVATTAVAPAVQMDSTQTGTTLMIAAGTTTSTGTVTVRSRDNTVDAPDKSVTVSATAAGGNSVAAPANITLSITDDEAPPTATLVLTPAVITENGEVSTVTARLSHPTTEATTLTVTTTAVPPAVQADFTRRGSTLTVAAGATTSTGTVTITSVDNTVASGRKQVTVAATAAGGRGVATPADATLTIRDDEFGLDESAVTGQATEGGGTAAFTVRLQTQPSAAVTVTVTSQDTSEGTVSPAVLVFTTSAWETAQPVTVTGVDDAVDDGDVIWQVRLDPSSSDTNYNGLPNVDVNVTTTDDDDAPTVTLVLTPPAITEAGGVSTVTATLAHPSGAATTVMVTATPVAPAVPADVTLSTPATLIVAAGATGSTGTVTVTANDNAVDTEDKAVTVSATVANALGGGMVREATLTLRDDDERGMTFVPAALVVAAGSTATYTVALTSMPTGPVTVTLTPDAAVTVDPARLPFPATRWNTAQPVTLTVAAGTTAPANLVDHRGTGSDYEGTTQALPVTRMTVPIIEPTAAIETRAEAGEQHYLRDNQLVTVMQAAAVPAGVRFTPAARLTRPLTLAVRPLSEAEATAVAGSGFRLGLPTERVALDVRVIPNQRGRLCLPVPDALWERAAGRPLVLLRAGEPVEGSEAVAGPDAAGRPRVVRVCADVSAFSPFAVGYEDSEELAAILRETTFTPADPAVPVELARRRLTEAMALVEQAKAEENGFRLGESRVHVALDVTVTPPVPGRLCLGVTPELVAEAKGRPLFLLHEGEELGNQERGRGPDAAGRPRVVRVCADVSAFSPFAVGYRKVDFSENDRRRPWDFSFRAGCPTFRADCPRAEAFPKAIGEGLITYRMERDLPHDLNYDDPKSEDEHGGTITGTATAPMAKQEYTLIARDADNGEAELGFTIEVEPGIERRDLALVLAGIGRTLASDAVEILGSRTGPPPARLHVTLGGQVLRLTAPAGSAPAAAPSPAAGTPSPLASAPSPLAGEGRGEGADATAPAATPGPSPWQRVTGVALGVARALGVTLDTPALPSAPPGAGQSEDSTFPSAQRLLDRAPADPRRPASPTWRSPLSIQPVSAKDLLARSAFELPLTRTDADGLPTWTVWGRGAASGFAGQPEEGFKMDGTLYSGYLGLDYRQASLLMGLAVAHSTGTVDYERTGGTTAGVDVQLTSLLPYAHWQPRPGLGLWGLLGAGWGEMDLKAVGDPTTYTTALTSWLGAVGGRQALTTWQGIDLAAKTDAFLTTLRSEAKTNLPGARGHAERVRLLLEGQTAVALSPVSRVQPRLEVGGRWDSGTAEQGLGLELGGGLAYTQTEWGLSVDMQGRYLLVHEDGAFEDWGASVNVRLDPGVGGEGAYLTVAPVWGQPGSGVEQLWGQAAAVPGGPPAARAAGWRPGNVEIDVGYGLALADGRGLLTPYGGLVLGDPGTARYRLGSRWALSTLLDLNIEGERAEQPGQAAHTVSVRLGWQW